MDTRRSANASSPQAASSPLPGNSSGLLNTVLVIVLIIVSLVAVAYLGTRLASTSSTGGAIKSKQYQALFLSNGQVYFGHLKNVDNSYVKVTDIYYLQVQQQVQPDQQKTTNQQQNVSLAKLGNELHGPEDSMYVSRDQVLFWENLKEDGKVAQAIKQYQSSGKK